MQAKKLKHFQPGFNITQRVKVCADLVNQFLWYRKMKDLESSKKTPKSKFEPSMKCHNGHLWTSNISVL